MPEPRYSGAAASAGRRVPRLRCVIRPPASFAGLFADAVLNRASVGDEVAALREPF